MSRIVRADGFSLIELAVVVVLIGLVLGIGVPSYLKATAGSRVGAAADGNKTCQQHWLCWMTC